MKVNYEVIKGFECTDTDGYNHVIPRGVYLTYDLFDNGHIICIDFLDCDLDSVNIENNFNIDQYLMRVEVDAKKETLGDKVTEELETYCSFSIANYALTDVIEALTAAKAKDIIVTKVDGNLVVKYKPHWRG